MAASRPDRDAARRRPRESRARAPSSRRAPFVLSLFLLSGLPSFPADATSRYNNDAAATATAPREERNVRMMPRGDDDDDDLRRNDRAGRRGDDGGNDDGDRKNDFRGGGDDGKAINENGSAGKEGNDDGARRGGRRPADDAAQRQLRAFFDNLSELQRIYGEDVVTVRDAAEAFPILARSYVDVGEECPLSYLPRRREDDSPGQNDGGRPEERPTRGEGGSDRRRRDGEGPTAPTTPCFTPVATIHDRVSNYRGPPRQRPSAVASGDRFNAGLPEVLLLGGLDGPPEEADLLGPSSILETLRLLLECARCESLSPWRGVVDEGATGGEDGADDATDANDGSDGGDGADDDDEIAVDGSNDAGPSSSSSPSSYAADALRCRRDLASRGVDDPTRRWLARLVATRRIVAVPIVDVAGFHEALVRVQTGGDSRNEVKKEEEECGGDFPYPFRYRQSSPAGKGEGSSSPIECTSKYPSRLINELFRSHAFQLGVAFRGRSEGGSQPSSAWRVEVPSWNHDGPPSAITLDERAMRDVARAYGNFADPENAHSVLSIERRPNCDRGAELERFAFSAGMVEGDGAGANGEGSLWMERCECDEGGGACAYPPERTGRYDGSSLRAFVARVATATPADARPALAIDALPGFGPSRDLAEREPPGAVDGRPSPRRVAPLLDRGPLGSGVRASLLAAELVEPYAVVRSVGGVTLRDDDVLPSSPRVPGGCRGARSMTMPESPRTREVEVTWTVSGALEVDETAIMYGKWDVLDGKVFDCVTQPTKQELDAFFTILRDFEVMEGETAEQMAEDVNFTPVQSGPTRWRPPSEDAAARSSSSAAAAAIPPPETTFSVTLDLGHYRVGDVIAVYSLARTDQGWAIGGDGGGGGSGNVDGGPPVPTQANFVNARTNPRWSHVHAESTDGGSLVEGRLDWFSVPVTIEIGPRPGFFESDDPVETSVRPSDEGYNATERSEADVVAYSIFMAVLVLAVTLFCVFCREERDGTDVFSVWREHRRINKEKISVDEFFKNEALELTACTTNIS